MILLTFSPFLLSSFSQISRGRVWYQVYQVNPLAWSAFLFVPISFEQIHAGFLPLILQTNISPSEYQRRVESLILPFFVNGTKKRGGLFPPRVSCQA